MYQDIIDQINASPLKSGGKYNSSRLNETWMNKNNLGHIFQIVMETTKSIQNRTIGQRFWAFEHLPIPLCECGKPVKKHDSKNQWSFYCSQNCASHSKIRANTISNTWKTLNKSEIVVKRTNTMIERYGVPYNSQREEMKEILRKSPLSASVTFLLNDKDWMNQEYNIKNRTAVDIAAELNIYYGTVLEYCRKHGFNIKQRSNYSKEERKLTDYLHSLNIDFITNTKSIIPNYELDVYIPEFHLAIEINGLYWHSTPEKAGVHLHKLNICQQLNIDLLQFTDLEINKKFDVVTSIIKNRLYKSYKINARDCTINTLDYNTLKHFLKENHLNGNAPHLHRIGLFWHNELVMVATFGKSRFTKHNWELIRMCPKQGYSVRGGFSKLLSWFKLFYKGSLVSYVDRNIGNGHGYLKSGFTFLHYTKPGYFWTDGNIVLSRYKAQKRQLVKWLNSYDDNKTEKENMINAGWRQYWTTGNMVFEML